MKEISIFELIDRLSKIYNKPLHIATPSDYECYPFCYNKLSEDLKTKTYHIGYNWNDRIEGPQFSPVATITNGKIISLNFKLDLKTINLGKLYIDNMEEKNIIVYETGITKDKEEPYVST